MIIIMIKSHLILMASLFSEERRSKQKEQEKQNCTDVGDHNDARLIEGLKLCGKHYSIYIAIFYIKNSYLKSIRVVATK